MTYQQYQNFIKENGFTKDQVNNLNDVLTLNHHQIYDCEYLKFSPNGNSFYLKTKNGGIWIPYIWLDNFENTFNRMVEERKWGKNIK